MVLDISFQKLRRKNTRFKHLATLKSLSHVWLFAMPWTVAHQDSPSMGFSRQEYWSGLPVPSPGDLPDPGIETRSPTLQADALTSEPPRKPVYPFIHVFFIFFQESDALRDGNMLKLFFLIWKS